MLTSTNRSDYYHQAARIDNAGLETQREFHDRGNDCLVYVESKPALNIVRRFDRSFSYYVDKQLINELLGDDNETEDLNR